SADLAAERAKAQKLASEARAEHRPDLLAVAQGRLAAISAEQQARQALANGRLSNGTTGTQYAASLTTHTEAQLHAEKRALEGHDGADEKLKLLATTRELDHRAA